MLFLKKLKALLSKVWFSEIIAVGQIKICIESLRWVEYSHRRESVYRSLRDSGSGGRGGC